ncbi:MAG: SDR family oxidoreductase [Myxococcales bacterium]
MQIAGSCVLITGANRGIGAALVDAFLAAGAARIYAASREIKQDPRERVISVALDVTDETQIAAAAARCKDVQVLVNNAGVAKGHGVLRDRDTQAAHTEMAVNYFGTLSMSRAFAPLLKANGGGAIVNMLSILARVSLPSAASYAASKAAAYSLTQALRAELFSQRTLVIGVMPGFVDTEMAKDVKGPKLSSREVADAVLVGLQLGNEDIYPGAAADVAHALQHDAKSVERRFAAMPH